MDREHSLHRIKEGLILGLQADIAADTTAGQYDVNTQAEHLLIPILNAAFGLNLINLNREQANYPGLDLGDRQGRRAFQVSATTELEKVKDTLQKVVQYGQYRDFDTIQLLLLQPKQKGYSATAIASIVGNRFAFDPRKDILDLNNVYEAFVQHPDNAVLKAIAGLLDEQYPRKEKAPTRYLTPYAPVNATDVIGREADLARLDEALTTSHRAILVNGMGGIGKTTLAQYCITRSAHRYAHIAWLTLGAGSEGRSPLVQTVAGELMLSRELGLPDGEKMSPEERFAAVMQALTTLPGPNLLVLDNFSGGDTRDMDRLPKAPHWQVLVTAREAVQGFTPVPLDFLLPADALLLFRRHCPTRFADADLKVYLEQIGYHTLTIEIVARGATRNHWSLDELRTALPQNRRMGVLTEHGKGLTIAEITDYLSSIFDLAKLSPVKQYLLRQLALLSEGFAPLEDLEALLDTGEAPASDLRGLLWDLGDDAWLLRAETDGNPAYRLHPILQQVMVKQGLPDTEEVAALISNLTKLLDLDEAKDNPVDKFRWIGYGRSVTGCFADSTTEAISTLQNNLGLRLMEFGDYAGAKDLLEKAVAIDEANFGVAHLGTAVSYSNLGLVLKNLGDYVGAKLLLEKAMAIAEATFGLSHPSIATCYSNLGLVLRNLGDYVGAKLLLEKALAINEATFELSHPVIAIRYSNLGLVLKDLEDYAGAKALLEKAVAIDEANFGLSHPGTAIRYSNLGAVLQCMGDYAGAKLLLEKAVAIDEANFGLSHPSTAIRYLNLAGVLCYMGDPNTALPLAEKALDIFTPALPVDHPHIETAKELVGTILGSL
jgi:tetratricopeptide (TPR) repeat protein